MRILSGRAAAAHVKTLSTRGMRCAKIEPAVKRIVDDVRRRGDRALRVYGERWDGLEKNSAIQVGEKEIQESWNAAPVCLRSALREAAKNIRRFYEWQKPKEWTRRSGGVSVGQIVRPLASVGCYVPGGRYPLVSTVLMTVIPAQIAGVRPVMQMEAPRRRRQSAGAVDFFPD